LDGVQIYDSTINYFGSIIPYSSNEIDDNYLDLNHKLFKELRNYTIRDSSPLYELRNSADILLLYCVNRETYYYPIINIIELLDYLICGKSIRRTSDCEHIIYNDLKGGLIKILEHEKYKLINHNYILFNHHKHRLYEGLKLIETNVNIFLEFE
jgi:hypothetical protein